MFLLAGGRRGRGGRLPVALDVAKGRRPWKMFRIMLVTVDSRW
jgi:hypothetical protein